ncbi:MAG: methylmalonyl-CoA epimerase [Candidatus Nanopelagicales bacterium]
MTEPSIRPMRSPLSDHLAGPERPPGDTIASMHTWITRIDHVGIAVADLDDAIDFYARTFGLAVVHTEVNEDQGVREAMLAVADSGSCIQLLAPLSADSPIGRFLDRSGPGIQQMAYTVTDIEAVSAHIREQGVRLLYDEPKVGTGGSLINFTHPKDSGGVLIELVEHRAAAH